MKIAAVLAVICWAHLVSGVTHSLQYFYTASSEVHSFPEFIAVGMVDGLQILHYDSNSKQLVPKQDWVNKAVDPQYWERNTGVAQGTQQSFKANVDIAMQRFNQTGGVHTVQNMYGCEWDDESKAADGFDQYGYDGEDWLSLDLKNLRWISTRSQSLSTQNKWNSDKADLEMYKNYYTTQCIEWLKKYLQYGSSTMGRKERPEATLHQKGTGFVCHATGFYPDAVMITWKRDGEEMQEDVAVGETLPNEDGTFQKRAVLTVSAEEWKNKQYTCEVAHQSGETIILDKADIKRSNPDSVPLGPIIGVVVALIVIAIAIVAGFVMLRKKKKPGFSRANSKYPTKFTPVNI
ncbi:class I histocompatibility antigen, F10 alpha chain-like [Alosa pseudoharengus]|uniref:class I histocompatibility antigen, F10 alpha chain-like n=1 Tax=Alosa pseudoharengus TaxID=34774 RepID=UPI003F8BE083